MPQPRGGRAFLIAAGSLVFLWLLCWLPYRVPFGPIYSISYIFGYNNRVAALLTGGWVLFLALLAPRLRLTKLSGLRKPLSASTLRKALLISGLATLALYLLTRKLDGVEESIYLIDRAKLLYEGHRPYRDFEFAYGALFLYGPVLLARLLHLRVADGYGLFWLGLALIGTYLLWKTLLWVEFAAPARRAIFLFFWAFSVVNLLTFGLSYTTFRYVLPCFLAVALYRRLGEPAQVNSSALYWLAPSFVLILAVSPELALSFVAGISGFLQVFGYLRSTRSLVLYAGNLVLIGLIVFEANRVGMFSTMMAFSHGANNLPVMPAPHLLLVFLLTGLAACYAGQRIRERQPDAVMALIAASVCGLTAALGSCDPLHAMLNPFGVMLAGSLVLAALPKLRVPVWAAIWVVFIGLRLLTLTLEWGMEYEKASLPTILALTPGRYAARVDAFILARMSRSLGPELARRKFANLQQAIANPSIDLPATFHLPATTIFAAPFGFAPGGFGEYHTPALDEGFFFENENVITPERVEAKVNEMHAHPDRPLLLLPGRENACIVQLGQPRFAIRPPFYYPYMARPVHDLHLADPICQYIRQNYRPASAEGQTQFGYRLWLPAGTAD